MTRKSKNKENSKARGDMRRSEGDTGVPQRGRPVDDQRENDPSVTQAMESGEPGIAGRSHGMVIDEDDSGAVGSLTHRSRADRLKHSGHRFRQPFLRRLSSVRPRPGPGTP